MKLLMIMGVLGGIFLMSMQPVMMVVVLIIISLLYSFFIYKVMMSYWFGYVLVMVMLSGVLVVFMYMVSMSPNESFEVYNLVFVMVFLYFFMFESFFLYKVDLSFISLHLWNSYISMFTVFFVSFLLCMMIMVVWVSDLSEGAVKVIY